MPHQPIDLTTSMLQAAYLRRRRANWPETFDAAMTDPICQRQVRLEATFHAQRQRGMARSQPLRNAARVAVKSVPLPTHPATLDAKRLAAGDRDD